MIPTNYPTRYQIVAVNVRTGEQHHIAYTGRKTLTGMIDRLNAKEHGGTYAIDRLASLTGTKTKGWKTLNRASDGAVCGDWRCRFSGRTERDTEHTGGTGR
mgnify:FL=1